MDRELLDEVFMGLGKIEAEVHEVHQFLLEEQGLVDEIPVDQREDRETVLHELVCAHERLAMAHEEFYDMVKKLNEKGTTS